MCLPFSGSSFRLFDLGDHLFAKSVARQVGQIPSNHKLYFRWGWISIPDGRPGARGLLARAMHRVAPFGHLPAGQAEGGFGLAGPRTTGNTRKKENTGRNI